MEIKEIVSHYLNHSNESLEVSFRTIDDDENELRSAEIPMVEITAFGYDFAKGDSQILEMFDDDDSDDDIFGKLDSSDESIDLYELTQFLNEYYLVYPDQLPGKELF
jgi:predicted DNA-binding transcriptional regulator YafY